jgi:site-specific recombinase XerD
MKAAGSVVGPYLDEFERSLRERRYQPSTIDKYIVHCQTFDSFLAEQKIALASLQQTHLEEFVNRKLAERRHSNQRYASQRWRRPIRLLLEHLSGAGLVSILGPELSDPAILAEYLRFLREDRGICQKTEEGQRRHLTQFLKICAVDNDSSVPRISIEQVDHFLIEKARYLARVSVNQICSALRGFLSYLHMRGLLDRNLAEHVTQPRLYSLSSLPRAIAWKDVERTLGVPDRRTLTGCRDYAVLALLAYCGLRAGEVAGLRLEDLDWSHDAIRVYRSKRETVEHLPLVPVVGEALIGYLKRRPISMHRQVFLKVLAPEGPLSQPSITWLTRKYLKNAGIQSPHLGAHTLRHSYAVRLLRQGFSLKTIGDALGHRHPQSTFIYAKAAVDDLREVCLDLTEVLP